MRNPFKLCLLDGLVAFLIAVLVILASAAEYTAVVEGLKP